MRIDGQKPTNRAAILLIRGLFPMYNRDMQKRSEKKKQAEHALGSVGEENG